MALQEPEVNGMTDSLKDLSMTGMLNRAIEEALANPTPIEEQPIADPTIDQNFQILEPADPLPISQIKIINQPETDKFR